MAKAERQQRVISIATTDGEDGDELYIEEPMAGIIRDLARTRLFGDGTEVDCVLDIVRNWLLENRHMVEELIRRPLLEEVKSGKS